MIKEIDNSDLDPQFKIVKLKLTISQASSEALAASVVAYRALGFNKDFALACMAELGRRRSLGEDFNFEEWIEIELAKIPKPEGLDLSKMGFSLKNTLETFVSEKSNNVKPG